MKRLFIVLLVLGLSGCGEGQKPNPLPRAGANKMDNVEPMNPLPKEAIK
jgi:hypothetical protein